MVSPAILEVLPLPDSQPISLHAIRLFHSPCSQEMQKHRNPMDDTYSLRCACGFEVAFPVYGAAARVINEAAIGQQGGTLPVESFISDDARAIEIRVRTLG